MLKHNNKMKFSKITQVAKMFEPPLKDTSWNNLNMKQNWPSNKTISSIIRYIYLYLDWVSARWADESWRTRKQSHEIERSIQRWDKITDKKESRTSQNLRRWSQEIKNESWTKWISPKNVSLKTSLHQKN